MPATEEVPYVTWGKFKEMMEGVTDETPLVISKDGEGSTFSPLADVAPGMYRPETTSMGEFISEPTEDDEPDEDTDVEEYEDFVADPLTLKVCCLWPVN